MVICKIVCGNVELFADHIVDWFVKFTTQFEWGMHFEPQN